MVEHLDLVSVRGKTGGNKMLTEWVTLSCKYQLPWGKKYLGLLAIWLSLELLNKSCCKKMKKIQDLSLSVTLKKVKINTPPAEVTACHLKHQRPTQ